MRSLEKSKRNKTSRINPWLVVGGFVDFFAYEFRYDCEI